MHLIILLILFIKTKTCLALNKKTFKTRTLTAILFAAVMLAGLLFRVETFFLLFLMIMAGCLYEFIRILKKIWPHRYGYFIPLALLYIVLPVLLMLSLGINIDIRTVGNEHNSVLLTPLIPCAIIFSIWINDTLAYIVGSFIGKTPFSKISPNKTWEGTIGGAVLCIVLVTLMAFFFTATKGIAWYHWMAIATICAVFGTLGDLLESKLKRMAGVKDSGSFMPGHGGFLDRFDSFLIATPFVALYVYLFLDMN